MQCRSGCGACCIAPSIREPLPGMPAGKPAGVRCLHLDEDLRCRLWGQPQRPAACDDFQAEAAFCGSNRHEAMRLLSIAEIDTQPDQPDNEAASSA